MKYQQPYTIRNQLNKLEKNMDIRIDEPLKDYLVYYEHFKVKKKKKSLKNEYHEWMY